MLFRPGFKVGLCFCAGSFLLSIAMPASAADEEWKEQLELLRQQNAALLETMRKQERIIENLNHRLETVERAAAKNESSPANEERDAGGVQLGRVNLSGSGAVAFFDSQRNGIFPKSEFRVDEARLFVEAPVWNEVYFFTELNLATREDDEVNLILGELYLDFENVSQLWGQDRQLNLRAGRLDVPFGEEYLRRDAIDNPLVSHSLMDFWGVDEGVEFYGALGPVGYVIAVQNGGVPVARDFDSDKSVAARLYYDPTRWLHFGLSAMRTGDIDANRNTDRFSEMWIGNGWFRSIGSTNTTRFNADLVQGDLALTFARVQLRLSGGMARYDDDDPVANNRRDLFFYSVEGVCELTRQLYVGARFSQIFCDGGYPLPGQGDAGTYFFSGAAPRAEELWRASIGLGYRFSPHLVIKTEYSFEGGREANGNRREHVDLFATQAAFGF